MKKSTAKLSKRLIALFLSVMMIFSAIPLMSVTADTDDTRVTDPDTVDKWQQLFGDQTTDTLNAGIVWRDKTVYNPRNLPEDIAEHITMDTTKNDNFLVSLSAIASNKEIKGYSNLPTDTMLVLDLSGSMADQGNAIANMVTATNAAMKELFELNPNNRVGIVLYSGNTDEDDPAYTSSATVLLPIDRYEPVTVTEWVENPEYDRPNRPNKDDWNNWNPTDEDGDYRYIEQTNEVYVTRSGNTISTATGLETEDGQTVSRGSKSANGGTYIQNGLYKAWQEFEKIEDTTVEGTGIQSGTTRIPIMVLMSDGAPTVATNSYNSVGSSNIGNGTSTSDGLGFLTQLTASWVREKMKTKYGREPLFYTLGLGSSITGVAEGVLDPYASTVGMNNYWNTYLGLASGASMNVYHGSDNRRSVSRDTTVTNQFYADEYFKAQTGDDLIAAFDSIVSEIIIQSRYYPTLSAGMHNFDGYITFDDEIADYMQITDVKGILMGGHLFSGAMLSKNFTTGGGELGTISEPTALGDEFIRSLRVRLGLTLTQAQALVADAYATGQLSYTSDTEFSNYVGWYADADGKYLGHWHEGHTTADIPEGATIIARSYEFLGEADEEHGVLSTDMMYVSVRTETDIATGNQRMIWNIPASLIPVVTYKVSFEGDSLETARNFKVEIVDTEPIQLLFEVELREDIDEYTVTELVDDDYHHINADGTYYFYSNRWGSADHNDHTIDYTDPYSHLTTVSTFEPSFENERYYYTENTPVLIKKDDVTYELATGVLDPSETYYHSRRYFVITDASTGAAEMRFNYEVITAHSLSKAQPSEDGNSWYIPKGTIYRMLEEYEAFGKKSSNPTETLEYTNYPYVENPVEDKTFTEYACATFLGNNGRLTLDPVTGIKITKTVPMIVAGTDTSFDFEVTVDGLANGDYPIRTVSPSGEIYNTTLVFADGKATVTLEAGAAIYIAGLPDAAAFTVTELEHEDYGVESATLNGVAVNGVTVSGTVVENELQQVAYENTFKTTGNLMIHKDIRHDLGNGFTADLSGKEFTVKVTLTGNDIPETVTTAAGNTINVATDGSFTFKIKDGETITITELADGLGYKVEEIEMGAGFSLSSESTGLEGTISTDANARAYLYNVYDPAPYEPSFTLEASKVLKGRDWKDSDTFIFQMQKLVGTEWVTVEDNIIVNGADAEGDKVEFTINSSPDLSFDRIGIYHYRIYELTTTALEGDFERIPGVVYDTSVHSFAVHVTDNDGDGKLEGKIVPENPVTVSGSGDNWTVNAEFTNVYAPIGNDTFTFEVQKKIEGSDDIPLSGFSFGVYSDADAEDLITTITTDANGKATYNITYSPLDLLNSDGTTYAAEKTFTYYIKEIAPADGDPTKISGMSYSEQVTQVVVELRDMLDGKIEASLVSTTSSDSNTVGSDKVAMTVTNTYDATDALLTLDGTKALTGIRDMIDGEFSFELYKTDDTFEVIDDDTPISTVTNTGNSFTFPTLSFDEEGKSYYVVTEKDNGRSGVSYDTAKYEIIVTVTDEDGTLVAAKEIFKVTASDRASVDSISFTNTYTAAPTSVTLQGAKTLNGRPLKADEFTFQLYKTGSDFSYNAAAEPLKETTNAANGYYSFTLDYTDLEVGTHYYVIKEKNAGTTDNGVTYATTEYQVTVTVTDNGLGKLTAAVSATRGGQRATQSGLNFENTYTAAPTSAQFEGYKSYNGTLPEGKEFSFVLKDKDGKELETVTAGKNESFSFAAITYDEVGVYEYTVEEVNGELGGVTYDNVVYSIKVTVTDDLEGQLEKAVEYSSSKTAGPIRTLNFTNTYKADDVDVTISGNKKLNDRPVAIKNGEFTFELYKRENASYSSASQFIESKTNDANGDFSFSKLTYTEADNGKTYYYTVVEKYAGETKSGVKYDNIKYYIVVTVSDNGEGSMVADVDTYHSEQAAAASPLTDDTLYFVNTYNAANGELTLTGTKNIEGRTMTDEDVFTFELRESDENYSENGTVLQSKQNVGKIVTFDTIKYDEETVKYYIVKEKNAGSKKDGITNDDTVYRVKVEVTDNSEGQLVVTKTVTKKGETNGNTYGSLDFVNDYSAAPSAPVTIGGYKSYNGTLAAGKSFSFVLKDEDGKEIQTVTAGKNENFEFDAITYDKADVYKYTVSEVKGNLGGVTYDDTVYTVTVTVTDNGKGQFVTATEYTSSKTTGKVSEITFKNEYNTTDVSVTFKGKKTLEGRDLNANEFTFELYESDANSSKIKKLDTQKNAADGTFSFDSITYSEPDVLYYLVVENRTDDIKGGVDYDETEYLLKVEITDNGEGALEAKVTTVADDHESLNFKNTYSAKAATLDLGGKKTLENKTLEAEQFSFILYEADESFAIKGEALETVSNDSEGGFSFESIELDKADTYRYIIVEDSTDKLTDIVYDDTVYEITVKVEDDLNGQLNIVEKTIVAGGEEKDAVEFVNEYDPTLTPKSASAVINILKELQNKGKDAMGLDGFEFKLEETGSKQVMTIKTDASGKASFTLDYNEHDIDKVFTYRLTEVDTGIEHMTYSSAAYEITVQVYLDDNGVLVADVYKDNIAVEDFSAGFVNVYDPPVETAPESPKTGYGNDLALWITLLFVSGGVAGGLIKFRKSFIR